MTRDRWSDIFDEIEDSFHVGVLVALILVMSPIIICCLVGAAPITVLGWALKRLGLVGRLL